MSDLTIHFVVPADAGRLDRLVADQTGQGRRAVRKWFEAGRVRVDGHIASAAALPPEGSDVVVESADLVPEPNANASTKTNRARVSLIHANARHIILAKPAGLHCERGKHPGAVAEWLEGEYGDLSLIGDRAEEAGLVHRIDRDTSGVLVAARTRTEYQLLRHAFQDGEAVKDYLALVVGRLEGVQDIDLPLTRRRDRMAPAGYHDEALTARTRFVPLDGTADWTLVLATMRTGAMHQIRAHASAAGHPLLGDALYGGPLLPACSRRGQLLHAQRIRIGSELDASVGPPEDFLAAYAQLRRASSGG